MLVLRICDAFVYRQYYWRVFLERALCGPRCSLRTQHTTLKSKFNIRRCWLEDCSTRVVCMHVLGCVHWAYISSTFFIVLGQYSRPPPAHQPMHGSDWPIYNLNFNLHMCQINWYCTALHRPLPFWHQQIIFRIAFHDIVLLCKSNRHNCIMSGTVTD